MSTSINVKVPEFAIELIEMKRREDEMKQEKIKKECNKTISAYAAVLGWYSREDGAVDVERCKTGLIELVKEYQMLENFAEQDYQSRCSGGGGGRGRPVWATYFMTEEKIGELLTQGSKVVDQANIERAKKILVAYRLLDKTFENFNEFVGDLWKEYIQEIENKNKEKLTEWQLKKENYDREQQKEIEAKLEKALEDELEKIRSTEEGKRKRKVPRDRTREIEKQLAKENKHEEFRENKPEIEEIDYDKRIEDGKLEIKELRDAIGRLK